MAFLLKLLISLFASKEEGNVFIHEVATCLLSVISPSIFVIFGQGIRACKDF